MLKTKLQNAGQPNFHQEKSHILGAVGQLQYGVFREYTDMVSGRVLGKSFPFPLTLLESNNPTPLRFYDYFNVEDSVWLVDENCVMIHVYASFLEKQNNINLVAQVISTETGEMIGEAPLPSAKDFVRHKAYLFIDLEGRSPENLAVIVKADITHQNGESTNLYATAPIYYAGEESLKLNPMYEHIYPKKEETPCFFGNTPSGGVHYDGNVSDPNHIVISLYRMPEESGDSDYVCNYPRGNSNPPLAVPAKGILNMGRSVEVKPILFSPRATIEGTSSKSGGKSYIALPSQFLGPIVNNGSITYEIETNWGTPIDQPGSLEKFEYNFELSFVIKYRLQGSSQYVEYPFKVSSKHEPQNSSTPVQYVHNILPLIIMWGCFAKGSQVLMADGEFKNIEDVKVGDTVISGETGAELTISNVWKGEESSIIKITMGNNSIGLTKNHPIYIKENGNTTIKRAHMVSENDVMVGQDNNVYIVTKVEEVEYNDLVYNVSIKGDDHCIVVNNVLAGDMFLQNSTIE